VPELYGSDFGKWLEERREIITQQTGIKMTQRQLALLANISNQEISRIEGGGKPSPDTLKAIAPHIRVPYVELLMRAGYITEEQLKEVPFDLSPELVDLYREIRDPNSMIGVFFRHDEKVTPEELRIALATIHAYRQEKRNKK
jgi:transcriptional regulator with XRE-family HTH domain